MSAKRTGAPAAAKRRGGAPAGPSRSDTDLARFRAKADDDIRRDIAEDPDAAPELDDAWFAAAERHMPQPRRAVLLRVDQSVVDWFKREGRGYQARMNAVLRGYVEAREREGA